MKTKKKIYLLYLVLPFTALLVSGISPAQTTASIFERHWYGVSATKINDAGDVLMTKVEMYNLSFKEGENSFTGTFKEIITDLQVYTTTYEFKGHYDKRDQSVEIEKTKVLYASKLPDEFYWEYPLIHLTLYKDSESTGNYILHGQGENQLYQDDFIELGTDPKNYK